MAWKWIDDMGQADPSGGLSLYDTANPRPRVGPSWGSSPDWMTPGADTPGPLLGPPPATGPQAYNYGRFPAMPGAAVADSMRPGPLMPPQTTAPSLGPQTPQGFDYRRFATLAGLAAQAISPASAGGRMGGAVASLNIHEDDAMRAYRQWLAEQQYKQQMMERNQANLRGLLQAGSAPTSRLTVQEGPAQAPGYSPGTSLFERPPVTTSLQGVGVPPAAAPLLSVPQVMQLLQYADPHQVAPLMQQLEIRGQLPSPQEFQSNLDYQKWQKEQAFQKEQTFGLMQDPRMQPYLTGRFLDTTIGKGQPGLTATQPQTPGAVEAMAVQALGGTPLQTLRTLKEQAAPPPTPQTVEAGAINELYKTPAEKLQAIRTQTETPVTLQAGLNEAIQRVQAEQTRLFGGVSATGMRIPGLDKVPLEDMIGLVRRAEHAQGTEERLARAQGRSTQPLYADILPSTADLTATKQGVSARLGREATPQEVIREWARTLIGRRQRRLPSLREGLPAE